MISKTTYASGFAGFLGLGTSTGQFSLSTGSCSMLGFNEHDKKVFLAYNKDKILQDSSKGFGEYLETYAYMSDCNKSDSHELGFLLQKSFSTSYHLSTEDTYYNIESLIRKNMLCR